LGKRALADKYFIRKREDTQNKLMNLESNSPMEEIPADKEYLKFKNHK
jgi:hypothetical protein